MSIPKQSQLEELDKRAFRFFRIAGIGFILLPFVMPWLELIIRAGLGPVMRLYDAYFSWVLSLGGLQ